MPTLPTDKNGYTLLPSGSDWWDPEGRYAHTEMCVCGHERKRHLYAEKNHPCSKRNSAVCGCMEFSPVEPERVALPHGFPWTVEELIRACMVCGHRYGVHNGAGSQCGIKCDCMGYVDPLGFSEKPKPVSETASHRLGECAVSYCGHLPQEHNGHRWRAEGADKETACTHPRDNPSGPRGGTCACPQYQFPL